MLKLLVSTSVLLALPAAAFAHPHNTPTETPDTPPNMVIKKMIQKGDVETIESDGKKIIMRRMVIDKDSEHDHAASWTHKGGDHHQVIDLGDNMTAKINGDNVIIMRGSEVLGATPPDGETVNVEKDVKIKNGRKKTRIVIELDAPAQ